MRLQAPKKFKRVALSQKRFIVLIGGRGSAKSESVARLVTMKAKCEGADVLCGREFQSSIDDSVHKLLKTIIESEGISGFDITDRKIDCLAGGGFRFKGFARNSSAVKSAQGFKYSWIEEAQTLSEESIADLTPTIRAEGSQLYFTANPKNSADPFSQRFIVPYLDELLKHGYYEDDLHLIVMMNWRDNPWHSVLEAERLWDKEHLSRAKYDHIWEGAFNDSVENAIISAEWFDAAIDAHIKLGFEPRGEKIVAHDPSDLGPDPKGLVYRHGSVILDAQERVYGDVNEGCDWATDYAIQHQVDTFIWDCDGLGVTLRRQVDTALNGKRINAIEFKGSHGVEDPGAIYQDVQNASKGKRSNKHTFKNKRAQKYIGLRDRFYNTYRAVEHGEYTDPEEMISISSAIEHMAPLRSEVCRIPLKDTGNGFIQILTKAEMRKLKIKSPNISDSLMMSLGNVVEDNTGLGFEFDSAYG